MGRRALVDQLAGAAEIADVVGVSNGQVTRVRRGGRPGETAKTQRIPEHVAWRFAYDVGTFGITAGRATP